MEFVVLIIVLALVEFGLSTLIGLKVSSEKNLGSDIIAAIIMVVIGQAYETLGLHILTPCKKIQELGVANPKECIEFGNEIMGFGQVMQTTMGMNSVLAALVLYIIIKLIVLVVTSRFK